MFKNQEKFNLEMVTTLFLKISAKSTNFEVSVSYLKS